MCGIIASTRPVKDPHSFHGWMANRGPDAFAVHQEASVTLAHSRLALIGGASATQPIHKFDQVLVCNGFISNYQALSAEWGVTPLSDCELILWVLEKEGPAGLLRLRGQFAFSLWDRQTQTLWAGRDPLGINPLYYALDEQGITFASQASWFSKMGFSAAAGLSEADRQEWLAYGFASGPTTLLSNVREVPAGTLISWNASHSPRLVETPYHHWVGPVQKPATSLAERIVDSASRNGVGDSEIWLLLSGGLDSLIALHALREAGVTPQVATLVYPRGQNVMEIQTAKEIARYYGVDQHLVDFPETLLDDFSSLFEERVDWPLDGGSLLPKIALADFIRGRGGRIALGGSGADELFGGYRRHLARLEWLKTHQPYEREAELAFYTATLAHNQNTQGLFPLLMESGLADPLLIFDLKELSQMHLPRIDSCFSNVGIEYRPLFLDLDIVRHALAFDLPSRTTARSPKRMLRQAFEHKIPQKFLKIPKQPLRFSEMGPTPKWRERIFAAWKLKRLQSPIHFKEQVC